MNSYKASSIFYNNMQRDFFLTKEFLEILNDDLRSIIFGTHQKHDIVSTRKLVAGWRTSDQTIRQLLESMNTIMPPQEYDSQPVKLNAKKWPKEILCSPCVYNTSVALMKQYKLDKRNYDLAIKKKKTLSESPEITNQKFLVALLEIAHGPMTNQWRSDGYTSNKLKEILANK